MKTFPSILNRCSVVLLLTLLATLGANANVIVISDTFTGTHGESNAGRTPSNVNLPGGTYEDINYFGQTNSNISTSFGNPVPSVQMSSNNLTAIPIASNPGLGYVKPTQFTVSSDFRMGDLEGGFLGLGFFGTLPPTSDSNHIGTNDGFNGILLTDAGVLSLKTLNGAVSTATQTTTFISNFDTGVFGTFDSEAFYNLAYDVNTATGDISNITLSLGGLFVIYDISTNVFTDASTNYLSLVSGSAPGGRYGYVDNLKLETTAIPEPSTWALILSGVAFLVVTRTRQPHHKG